MADLPRIDEHAVSIEAPVAAAWAALLDTIGGPTSRPLGGAYARAVGCRPARARGPRPLEAGSTVPGFAVVSAVPEEELALAGRHAFSTYELVFRLQAVGVDGSEVRAESRATFPGPHGLLYRTLVIGTGFHVVAVRRLLGTVRRRAEDLARRAPG